MHAGIICCIIWADPAIVDRGGPDKLLSSHQRTSKRAVRTSHEKHLDPRGPNASRWEFIPVFQRKPIAICYVQEGADPLPSTPLDPRMISNVRSDLIVMGLKTYVANFYAHHSRVRKQVKLSGSCISTIY